MDVDLKKLTMNTLETLCQQNITALFNLQNEATPDPKKKKNFEDFIEKLSAEIKSRETEVKETKPQDTGSLDNSSAQPVAKRDYMNHEIKTMSSTIVSEIPVFSSGHDVHIWLTKIESYHKLFVAPDSTGVM